MRISASPQMEEVSLGAPFGTGSKSNKANSVKHQYYNKERFFNFQHIKQTNKPNVCLLKLQNKQQKD